MPTGEFQKALNNWFDALVLQEEIHVLMQYVRLTTSACMRIELDPVCALSPGQDLVVLTANTVNTHIILYDPSN